MSREVTKEEATGFGLNKTSQHRTVQTADSLDFGFTVSCPKKWVAIKKKWVAIYEEAVGLRRWEAFMAQFSTFYARKLPKN